MADIAVKAESETTGNALKNLCGRRWFTIFCVAVLVLLTLASRICVAYFLSTDEPGDGRVYTQLAANLLEQKIFSLDAAPPFAPTLVRLPGYPLFIAAVYYFFGLGNDLAVRIVQAFFDTATCVTAAAVAWQLTDDEKCRRKNSLWTFVLAALCPFTAIYVATLLTETLTIFLMAAMTLTAVFALKAKNAKKSLGWWILTGMLAGAAVLLRPDSGLFAAGIGLTLLVSGLFIKTENAPKLARRLFDVGWRGAVFSLCFILVLVPWTIRNYRVFDLFQPLAPAHAEMPGEFVPHGYDRWLRTWVDDWRFVEPMLWNLNEKPISVKRIPASTFDSDEERTRVAALLEQYNSPPGSENKTNSAAKSGDDSDDANSDEKSDDSEDDGASSDDDKNDNSSGDNANSDEDKGDDAQADSADGGEQSDDENKHYVVQLTPEIDAGFAAIADERIARAPVRYYVLLPVKRAVSQWFDTHSLYYPFGGEWSPTENLDYDEHQEIWLPVFAGTMWIYTLLAFGGTLFLWRSRKNLNLLRGLLLILAMSLPRIVFLSSVENPEPRYVVELFFFTAVLSGFFLGNLKFKDKKTSQIETTDNSSPFSLRLISLDVFRGMTVAAMVLVNAPGSWSAIYAPFEHADWNGATPTDFIFPFFLFIVGVSIALALGKQIETRGVNREIYGKILRRSLLIFALGLLVAAFPFYNLTKGEFLDVSTVRIMGVLQRIAICYLVSALIFLKTNWKRQSLIVAALLLIYWALMTLINVPGCETTTFNDKTCNLAAYIDRAILTENHLWKFSKVFDPEGLLSTVPAIVTTLTGVLTGQWLRREKNDYEKCAAMFFCGVALTAIGWTWSFWFPLNKTLWTSSYVFYTSGLALCFLGFCYWLIDIKGYRKWSKPFVIFGTNAIALYVGSSVLASVLDLIKLQDSRGNEISLQETIFNRIFLPAASPANASLMYAVSFTLVWLFLMWLLYRKKIFIKI